MPKNFYDLTAGQCEDIYQTVQKNAETHFRIAHLLSQSKQYSNAIAHHILGTEELIKATVLFLESKQFNLKKIEGYKLLFYNHKARHSIIKEFFSVWLFCKNIFNIEKKRKQESSFTYFLKAVSTTLEGVLVGVNNYDWWSQADTLKQNCFYVDYRNGLIKPDTFTKSDYDNAEKHVMSFRKDVRIVMLILTKSNEEQLQAYRESFIKANFQGLLTETLKRSKK